jgi:hypothetical protein
MIVIHLTIALNAIVIAMIVVVAAAEVVAVCMVEAILVPVVIPIQGKELDVVIGHGKKNGRINIFILPFF